MLQPKRTKFRKMMKGRNRGYANNANTLALGDFARKGKGGVEEWVMNIKPGRIIFELAGVSEELAREALTIAMHKLPFKTKFITRQSENEIY